MDLSSGQLKREMPKYGGCKGGILADSMGLGKTAQMLVLSCVCPPNWEEDATVLEPLVKSFKTGLKEAAVLVVTPVSVNVEWDAEIEKHTTGKK